MPDREKVIKAELDEIMDAARAFDYVSFSVILEHCVNILNLLKEQEAEIRQLRLALDIVKGTCKGIAVETDEKFMGDL